MANTDIVSLIKNLIAQQVTSEKAVKQLELVDDAESVAEVLYDLLVVETDDIDQEDQSLDSAPLYNWIPPDIPSIQIQPFVPKDIPTPDDLSLVSQNIELSADGGTTVTATVSCSDVIGAAEYEFRLSGG
jgi:hypothetical protein